MLNPSIWERKLFFCFISFSYAAEDVRTYVEDDKKDEKGPTESER